MDLQEGQHGEQVQALRAAGGTQLAREPCVKQGQRAGRRQLLAEVELDRLALAEAATPRKTRGTGSPGARTRHSAKAARARS